ncbi:hypothetical protein ACRAWF_33105 [Streptomyces sp. L7]
MTTSSASARVPRSALFPRMAAVVHHCGAGTTAAGRAPECRPCRCRSSSTRGFWAARLVRRPWAWRPAPYRCRGLTADTLAAALVRATRDPAHADRARVLGAPGARRGRYGSVLAALHGLA